jgi:hypothetical protein
MNHAFLIIANRDSYTLNKLIESIDSFNHDIYILFDKKSSLKDDDVILPKKSKLFFIPRINIVWGAYSQVEAELALLNEAYKKQYDYYHIISGNDLMIRKKSDFDLFFEDNKGKEFITYCGKDWQNEAQNRVKYRYLAGGKDTFKSKVSSFLVKIQKLLHKNRIRKCKLSIVGGCNWVSITNNATKLVLDNKKVIKKIFNHGYCVDELFIHTIIYNSDLKNNIYYLNQSDINDDTDFNMYKANQRYIDWVRGKPYTFKLEDFNQLIDSKLMFARKFDSTISKELIDKIVEFNKE